MEIYNDTDALKNVLAGAKAVYDPVKTTLGPKGRNVLIKDKFGKFTITHDGVTVSKAINLKDSPISIGAEIIKEASKKMDETGDGTTSVTVLTYHLIAEAVELIKMGANPMVIKKVFEAEIEPIVAEIKKRSKKMTKKDVLPVATVSVGDAKLGKQIADFMAKLDYKGAITVEATQYADTTMKVVDGFVFDRGYMSPYFASDAREAILEAPAIIVTKGTISDIQDYEKLLLLLKENQIGNCLVIAENVEADALNTFILNKVKGAMNFCVVKAPGQGDARLDNLKDICAATGATLIDPGVDGWKEQLDMETFGAAEKVVVNHDETVIIGGQGRVETQRRVTALKARLPKAKLEEKEDYENRIARLEGKVGVIKVGGHTETDAEERKYRIDDAVAAVRAGLKEGIVAGGGVTLRDIARSFEDESLKKALCSPYETLLENSGVKVAPLKEGEGVNVFTGEVVNMIEAGIVDPAKVTMDVVRNAITTACLAITVGGAIVDTQLSHEEMMNLMNQGR